MKNLSKIIFGIVISYGLLVISHANAQTAPEFLISWRALNFVPADFQGKIFPVKKTPVKISFELIDGGKIANLSQNSISWFLNGDVFQSGNGLKTIIINSGTNDQPVRITVAGYRGITLEKVLIVPAIEPEVIISARFPQPEAGAGQHQLEAKPYFFNVFDAVNLAFSWLVNGEALKETVSAPQFLNLNLGSSGISQKTNLSISVNVINRADQLETASKFLNLTVK